MLSFTRQISTTPVTTSLIQLNPLPTNTTSTRPVSERGQDSGKITVRNTSHECHSPYFGRRDKAKAKAKAHSDLPTLGGLRPCEAFSLTNLQLLMGDPTRPHGGRCLLIEHATEATCDTLSAELWTKCEQESNLLISFRCSNGDSFGVFSCKLTAAEQKTAEGALWVQQGKEIVVEGLKKTSIDVKDGVWRFYGDETICSFTVLPQCDSQFKSRFEVHFPFPKMRLPDCSPDRVVAIDFNSIVWA